MKNMLRVLAGRSFRAGRMRNLIAVLAIMLTSILFTTVTTVSKGTVDSIMLTMQMQKGSRSDGDFRSMTAEQFEALADADFIREYGLRMPVGFLTNTTRHNIELDVLDSTQAELTFCMPSHGDVPTEENEIVASDVALRDLGVEPEVGAVVPIVFTAHGQEYRMNMVVSGWYEALNGQMSVLWAGTAFRDAHPDIFTFTYDQDYDMVGTYYSDFTATSTVGLKEKLDDWVRQMGGDPDAAFSGNLSAVVNTVTNPTLEPSTILFGAVVVALFILCGYLLIYNVFDIAVMQEIQRYGLYRTIGMSKRQVKKLINRQAIWLSCIGIPLGLLIGFFVGKGTLPFIVEQLSSDYENVTIHVNVSPVIFAGAAVLTAFTVFLSTRKPVRVAANIPPIEAFRYVEAAAGKRTSRKGTKGASIPRLAWSNLGRSRRRTVFIMASLMLCIVLLNCAGVAAVSVDVEKQVAFRIRTDFAVVNTVSTNNMEGFTRREHGLGREVIDAINAQPGVTDAAAVYKNTLDDSNVTYDFPVECTRTGMTEETGIPYKATDSGVVFHQGDDGHALCNVYGMEENAVARMNIQEGETDAHALYEQMKNGEGLLLGVMEDRSNSSMNPALDVLDVGDVVTVYKNGEPVMELPVLAKAALNGDDMEIGYTVNGTNEVGGDGLLLYLPTDIYTELYEEPVIYKYAFNVEEDQQAAMTEFLENYVNNVDSSLNYASAEEAREQAVATRTMLLFVGGLIGGIFGVAGVLNLINTMITTILARRHEFATMQSIGMTKKQLTRMMVWEGIYYAFGACAAGLVVSVILGFTVVRTLTGIIWYFTFHFTIWPAVAACVVLLIVAALVSVLALKAFNKGSIVEKLRVSE